MKSDLRRRMSDAHERDLAAVLGVPFSEEARR